jgi:hypothetical protein
VNAYCTALQASRPCVYNSQLQFLLGIPQSLPLLLTSLGAAALLSGGILWWLIIHFIDSTAVLRGLSLWAYFTDMGVAISFDQTVFVKDSLQEDEVNYICGKYTSVLTGVFSWWPDPQQSRASSYRRGWWLENAKHFFQTCLALYSTASSCKPMTRGQWDKNHAGMDQHILCFIGGTRNFALAALAFFKQVSSIFCLDNPY